MAKPMPLRTSHEWEFVNTSDLGSTSTQPEQQPGQLCAESEESNCLTAVNVATLSSSGKTEEMIGPRCGGPGFIRAPETAPK